jgi:NTP pyrophosphatase (non-canonical NTP hydrolase)
MSYDPGVEQRLVPPLQLRAAVLASGLTAIYPDAGTGSGLAILYLAAALAGEAGEAANQMKKVMRDDGGVLTEQRRAAVKKELGGVLWYWLRACYELGLDPDEVAHANLTLLKQRRQDGTLRGDDVGERRVAAAGVPKFRTAEEAVEALMTAEISDRAPVEGGGDGWIVRCHAGCAGSPGPMLVSEEMAHLVAHQHVLACHVLPSAAEEA